MTQALIAAISSISFAQLPALGSELAEGTFRGITTLKDGTPAAVILLPNKAQDELTWSDAMAWAESVGGQLPTRPVAALLYANAEAEFEGAWHWTSDTLDADTGRKADSSYAWFCDFRDGRQDGNHKSNEFSARAVRLIPLVI